MRVKEEGRKEEDRACTYNYMQLQQCRGRVTLPIFIAFPGTMLEVNSFY